MWLENDGGEGSSWLLVLTPTVGAQAQAPAPETPLVPLFSADRQLSRLFFLTPHPSLKLPLLSNSSGCHNV